MVALFDFSNAQLPNLFPLGRSYDDHEIDRQLKELFLLVFSEKLAGRVFDANVLGAAHLGSFPSVQRAVNADGLVLLKKSDEEPSTRYLYRAWMSANGQGRGLHFLRTYLQLQFPNLFEISQLWSPVEKYEYPFFSKDGSASSFWLHQVGEKGLKLDGSWGVDRLAEGDWLERAKNIKLNNDGMFLTSRVEISVDISQEYTSSKFLIKSISSVIPARLVPSICCSIYFDEESYLLETEYIFKFVEYIDIRMPWLNLCLSKNNYVESSWKVRRRRTVPTILYEASDPRVSRLGKNDGSSHQFLVSRRSSPYTLKLNESPPSPKGLFFSQPVTLIEPGGRYYPEKLMNKFATTEIKIGGVVCSVG